MQVRMISHPSGELMPILLGKDDLPVCMANEFILGRRALASNTLIRNLRELAILHEWAEFHGMDMTNFISGGSAFNEAFVRGSLVESLRLDRSNQKVAVSPHTFNQRLTTIRQYFSWSCDLHLSSLSSSDHNYEIVLRRKNSICKWLDSCFINSPPSLKIVRKGLNDAEVSNLLTLLNPGNVLALGRDIAVKHRNYVMTMLMLSLGLRPGELLSLRVEDIEIGACCAVKIVRRRPDKDDLRKPRPQIKRNSRIIPIVDQSFSKCIDQYILIWRESLEKNSKKVTDYLILSDEGEPLSQSSVTQFFRMLRCRYQSMLPANLSAKSLRHTFSSKMEKLLRESGLDEDRRRKALAMLRGDSSLNSQSIYIEQEIEDIAKISLRNYQKRILGVGDE